MAKGTRILKIEVTVGKDCRETTRLELWPETGRCRITRLGLASFDQGSMTCTIAELLEVLEGIKDE